MKLSVLIASRGRPEMLQASIDTFKGDSTEFLVAVDRDDPGLPKYRDMDISLTVTKRYGYPHLEKYYNILAKKAKGDWLFNWNDDASLGVGNIENLLDELDYKHPIIAYFDDGDTRFPIMSRGMYDLIGHFAAGPSIDSYIHALAVYGGAIRYLPRLEISHQRDVLEDLTAQQKNIGIADERMRSDEVVNQRNADIEKIKAWRGIHEA